MPGTSQASHAWVRLKKRTHAGGRLFLKNPNFPLVTPRDFAIGSSVRLILGGYLFWR